MAKREISIEDRRRRDFVRHWKGDAIEAARAAGFRDPKLAAFMLMQDASIYAQLRKKDKAHMAEGGMTISVDGTFGQKTAEALNAINPALLLPAICAHAEQYYRELEGRRPEMKAWFANWNHRAAWMPPQVRTGFESYPAGFPGPTKIPCSDFGAAIEVVITTHEGGFQDRQDDPGNWTPDGRLKGTKYGISAHSFPDEDIKNLSLNRAEELYRQVWGKFALISDQRVLTKALDLAVNLQWGGHGHATEILQRAINECAASTTRSAAASSS